MNMPNLQYALLATFIHTLFLMLVIRALVEWPLQDERLRRDKEKNATYLFTNDLSLRLSWRWGITGHSLISAGLFYWISEFLAIVAIGEFLFFWIGSYMVHRKVCLRYLYFVRAQVVITFIWAGLTTLSLAHETGYFLP